MQKILVFSIILLAASSIHSLNFAISKTPPAATAINELIQKFFVHRSIDFSLIVHRSEIIDQLLNSFETPIKVVNVENNDNSFHIDRSAVLIFNNKQEFVNFHRKMQVAFDYPRELHFFVYIESNDDQEYSPHSDDFKKLLEFKNFNFLFEGDDFIDLVTFMTFQQPNCRELHPFTVNRFSKASRKWETNSFSMERFMNFNKCELAIWPNNIFKVALFDRIHKTIESSLNFTSIVLTSENQPYDFFMLFSPARMMLVDPIADSTFKPFSSTYSFLIVDFHFLVSRSAPYSYLEKALMPFENEVWYWLIGSLSLGVIAIVVISCMSKKIRRFVFGLRVQAPMLNMM
jgi:hypothetical protein